MKKIVLLYFLIVTIVACNEKNDKKSSNNSKKASVKSAGLNLVDTLVFQLDNKTGYNETFQIETVGKNEFLGTLNRDNNEYILYSLKNFKPYKYIKFDNVGPSGVGEARSVRVHNFDSIFVVRYLTNILYLLDSSSTVKNKWTLQYANTGELIFNISSGFRTRLEFLNNKVYLIKIPDAKVFTKEYWNNVWGIVFNIKQNKIYNSTGIFPDVYKQGISYGGFNTDVCRIVTQDGLSVYGFSLDKHLYVYNDSALIKKVSIPSKYVSDDVPTPQKKLTGYNYMDDWLYEIQRGSYRWMAYDKYNKVIYRLVLHATDPYDVNGNRNKFWDKPFSIQIIDSTFNLIGEENFPAKQYDYRNILPTKNGLLISLCHNDNPILEENKLKLALFRFSYKNEN